MIDLHLHTNMSDGTDTPAELLQKVESMGCKVFSITDHDTLEGNAQILSAIKMRKYAAKFVTGVEIASVFESCNLHLLCHGFNPDAKSINEMAAEGAYLRRLRITALFEHLAIKHNIIIPDADKAEIMQHTIPGKMHIFAAAKKLGVDVARSLFFKNYLDDMESRLFKLPAERVIAVVAEAGGVVSFAHPVEMQREYNFGFDEIAIMSKKLKDVGLTGIEAYHSFHGQREIEEYKKIAATCNLAVSGGSDYHGTNKDVAIGQLSNCGFVPKDKEMTLLRRLKI